MGVNFGANNRLDVGGPRLVLASMRFTFVRRWATRLSSEGFFCISQAGVWFCLICCAVVLAFTLADLNGSSAGVYSDLGLGPKANILLGHSRAIRFDEWASQTPAALNQVLKVNPLTPRDSTVGGHDISLTANLPVRDVVVLFRPQLWPFFFLPLTFAFAAYWYFKALLVVLGVFAFLLVVTRSTLWAITGSLWYFFSPFMQWCYSWPSGLPEMIGSLCIAIVCACYLSVGRNRLAICVSAALLAASAINFVMCAYLPHLIPLAWLAVLFCIFWFVGQRDVILTRERAWWRAVAAFCALAVIGSIGWHVYSELRPAIAAVAATEYPGERKYAGGMLPLQNLLSQFFEWNESAWHYPRTMANICGAAGCLWLAPLGLLAFGKVKLEKSQRWPLVGLLAASFLLLAWALLPVPASAGAPLGLDLVQGNFLVPALGLANVAIFCLVVSRIRRPLLQRAALPASVLILAIMLLVLHWTNIKLNGYFPLDALLIAASAVAVLSYVFFRAWHKALAFLLVVPQALILGQANPVERGLKSITQSQLFQYVQAHPDAKQGKWIVFSSEVEISSLLSAAGCDVYTGLHYIPDTDHFAVFARHGIDVSKLNRAGLFIAHALPPGRATRVRVPAVYQVDWDVSATDPILNEIGIQYFLFDKQPSADETAGLRMISSVPINGFWLYCRKG